ncbi:glycosyltransferase family 4 protein [Streptomyces rimosus]|uniref:glycosyltransferase family 4 protein n=1 Tax=Streptomyces rimosus TaxID=1927 RepID=UPI0004C4E004|nr:glycosyltransferase family 4 protein [Streptomyces rimosus]
MTGRDIFFVSNNVDEMGGVTTWSHQMARLFAERGHRVHVIGVVPAPEDLRADLGADLPYETTTLYDVHPPKAVPAARGIKGRLNIAEQRRRAARQAGMEEQAAKLSALFRAARPGGMVIVTQVWAMEWVALADTAGLPVVGMTHESFEACRKSSRFNRVKKHYKGVDRLLALTREDADLWIRQGMDNADFMPNPLPVTPEVPSDRTAKVVASIGRLSDEKGVDLLLDTWAAVAPDHPDWTLRIYGSGEDEEILKKQADTLGLADSVEFMGRTDDVAGALRGASVFAQSSRAEGFPLSLMEAMASGVPCAAFDCAPGVHEIVRDGEDGLLAVVGNTAELARHIDALISDKELRDRLGTAARENVQRYSTDRIVKRWEDLFALLER